MLNQVRSKAILKGITMTQLSKELGISRTYMYKMIRSKDSKIINKINLILLTLDTNVHKCK